MRIGRMLSNHIAAALAFEDAKNAEESLHTLSKHDGVRFAALYDASGKRFAEWHEPASPAPAAQLEGRHAPVEVNDAYLDTFHEVWRGETRLGTLHLRSSTASLSERTRKYLWNVAGVAVGTGL